MYTLQAITPNRLKIIHVILLTTLNARYSHSSLGLRYLRANMGQLRMHTQLMEFNINQRVVDIAEQLLSRQPRIIGIGVYIWNYGETLELVTILKTVAPEVTIILGGPEVSYEWQHDPLVALADYLICGMGDLALAPLCRQLLDGHPPQERVVQPERPELAAIELPYAEYTDEDIAHRVIYVEASRGCPFRCEFCLSALDKSSWPFETERFLAAIDGLYRRGARRFKFVDRTFNLKVATTLQILEFFHQRLDAALHLHFELVPDQLPTPLKQAIMRFPAGVLQFELGVQSLNSAVQARIDRRQDNPKTLENLLWLQQHRVHIHADLIFGLPGEGLVSIADGFNRLVALGLPEIQLGILKRLRGTSLARHSDEFQMRYHPLPPYNLLANRDLDFVTMQRLGRMARYWDLISNSGRFGHTLALICDPSPFQCFMGLSDWLFSTTGQTHKIELRRLFALINEWLIEQGHTPAEVHPRLRLDYQALNGGRLPGWLQ